MSALQAPHAIPISGFGSQHQKPVADVGRLPHDTFEELPPRFKAAAKELARRGEIIIQDNNIGRQVRETTSKNARHNAALH